MSKGRVLTKKKWGHCARYHDKCLFSLRGETYVGQVFGYN